MISLGLMKMNLRPCLSDMSTQKQALLEYLKKHPKGITTWQAFDLGITCLWKRISDLEAKGHKIERTDVHKTNRYGNPCKVVRYRLTKVEDA